MRRLTIFGALVSLALCLAAAGHAAGEQDWTWLVSQAAGGMETVTLANDIVRGDDQDTGLAPAAAFRVEGNGFSITGALVDGGTVLFSDVRLLGIHGVGDEDGGDALTLRGEGTIAVLMGTTRAEGGLAGPDGLKGGDGVQLLAAKQGLLIRGHAMATGGIGRAFGGHGVYVTGCDASILMADSAAAQGAQGIGVGGAGIEAPSCCKVTLQGACSATGGSAQSGAGAGIRSALCEACGNGAQVSLTDMAMAIGAIGQDGGHALVISRAAPGEAADLLLGDCMLIGGDGVTSGSAVMASRVNIEYAGIAQAFGGRFFTDEAPAMLLEGCEETGDRAQAIITEGAKTDTYPASDISTLVNNALSQVSSRYVPKVLEEGLFLSATETKLNGFIVDRGSASQANVNGSLKIHMYTGTLEKRMQFRQRLMEDGKDGTRLVLIGTVSDEWPTVETTVAALRKLDSIGITQLAYTCVAPTYHERIIDLRALLDAVDAYEAETAAELPKLMLGTADDAVIFVGADSERVYQEGLMEAVVRAG